MKKYNLYDNDEFIGVYTAKEISNMTGASTDNVYTCCSHEVPYQGRYRFELASDDNFVNDFKREWNKYRFMILGNKCKT